MPDISLTMVVLLCLAALAAGWIDAVVGGGGLLLLPTLLLGLPNGASAAQYALGTNKAVAIVGTTGAAVTYARRTPVDVKIAVRIGLAALAGSTAGAFVAAGMSTEILKPVVMVVLLAVGAFVILRPSFGTTAPATGPVSARRVLAAIGLAGVGIGFYDGLIGPGTGTFLVLALTAVLHLDLVTASATAKIVNCCTNAGCPRHVRLEGHGLLAAGGPDGGLQPRRRHRRRPDRPQEGQRLRPGRPADGGVHAGFEDGVRTVDGVSDGVSDAGTVAGAQGRW